MRSSAQKTPTDANWIDMYETAVAQPLLQPVASMRSLADKVVFLMFASAFVVYIEPAPVDLLFLVFLGFFVFHKLPETVGLLPLILLLIVYNLGGVISYLQAPPMPKALSFIVTSSYMALSGIVIALYVATNPLRHTQLIYAGWIVGAAIASVWGLIDYFHLPSPFPLQVLPGRATGLFKDPNVFSTFIILPAVVLLQRILLGTPGRKLWRGAGLALILLALFLAFSRGAWMNFVAAAALASALTLLFAGDPAVRTRILLTAIGFIILAAVGFLVLMSIPKIAAMFTERFALVQYYDAGETGRFGNQLRSIPDLIVRPLGLGPFVFRYTYGQDPHNTFLNAFASYGWLGGIAYINLVIATIIVGLRNCFTASPFRMPAIAVFSVLLSTILQGVQIDTEHWRHFYWLLGLNWGLFAATLRLHRTEQDTEKT